MPEILLTFTGLAVQKGAAAQVVSLVSEVRQIRHDVQITLLSHYSNLDQPWAATLGVGVAGYPLDDGVTVNSRSLRLMGVRLGLIGSTLSQKVGLRMARASNEVVASAYRKADLVLDLSGDSYRDPPGGRSIAHNVNLLACQAVGVPYAIVSQSLGPFRTRNRWITRYCLNRARLIYVRERSTFHLLAEMGVNSSLLHLGPDLAFVLPVAPPGVIDGIVATELPNWHRQPSPRVGISTSDLLLTRLSQSTRKSIIRELAGLAQHINHKLGGSVCLIPHYIVPSQLGSDDLSAADLLAHELRRPAWLHVFRRDCGPSEIKGLISRFDAFVACRMHAGIAALSSGVPTLMVAWSPKYAGIMDEIGLRQFVWDVQDHKSRSLASAFESLWDRRDDIKERLDEFNRTTGQAVRFAVERVLEGV